MVINVGSVERARRLPMCCGPVNWLLGRRP